MKIYIAGPIAGYPDLNRAAFTKAAEKLTSIGFEPINPHDILPIDHGDQPCKGKPTYNGDGHSYGCHMVPDLQELLTCAGYTLLDGWRKSRGATLEEHVARVCGNVVTLQ